MGHLSLKIQTSALFLKAKHAFSLHRKSSLNSSSSSTLSSPSTSPPSSSSSPTALFSTALNTPPSSSASSSSTATNSLTATTNSTTGAGVAPLKQKSKRSSRFKVKTFASFRDRSTSPPLTSSSTSSTGGPVSSGSTASSSSLTNPSSSSPGAITTPTATVTATTATTATRTRMTRAGSSSASASTSTSTIVKSPATTPPSQSAPVFSVNPYSSSWSPSTVAILKSPLRTRSSSKASNSLDLMQCSLYSPAPNLILQPSPAIDLSSTYAAGVRSSTSRAMLHRGGSDSSSLLDYRIPVFGPQGVHTATRSYYYSLQLQQQGIHTHSALHTLLSVTAKQPVIQTIQQAHMDTQSPPSINRTTNGNGINNNNANGINTPTTTSHITQFDYASTDSVISTDGASRQQQRIITYPTPEERKLLIDQHYNIMLRGPVFIDFLSKLPYEIAIYILLFVDMHNLTKVALISRTWNQFSRDNEVWKNVYLHQKQWKVRIPPSLPRKTIPESTAAAAAALVAATSPQSQEAVATPTTAVTKQIITPKPLNWKMLCHDRIRLERRWTTVPPKTKLLGHTDSVYCVQFDHSKIVTGSRDQSIKFWDLHTLKCTHTLRGHSQSVLCLQFNDRIMVSGSSDNTIIVWDMQKRTSLVRLHGHTAGVLDVCFDDQYIVSCSKDTSIKVWDAKTFALVKTMTGHRGPVNAVQLHKGQVVSASGDGMVKLWNIGSGQCVRDFIGHDRGLACVQFDGETIVSGSNDKTIKIWEARSGRCLRTLTGHTALVRTLHFENNRVVSGSYDHTVKVWDMTTGQCILNLDSGHSSWVFDVQFSSSRIISTSQDRNIIVWDFAGDLDVRLFE